MKNILMVIAVAALYSCGPENMHRPQPIAATAVSDTLERLSRLLSVPDSFPAYMELNKQLYISYAIADQPLAGGQYLDNIIRQHDRAVKDTALKKVLAFAYYNKAEDNNKFSYDEAVVKYFEQYMLLSSREPPYYGRLAGAANNLGIQYNILGDLKKCTYYYAECAKYSLLNRDYNLYASGMINNSIALNELRFYDSTIRLVEETLLLKGIAQKRLAGLYASLSAAQSKKHLYNEAIANAQTSLGLIKTLPPAEVDDDMREKEYQMLWNLAEIQSFSGEGLAAARTMDLALHHAFIYNDSSYKNREIGKMFIARGRITESTGNRDQALSFYHKALSSVINIDPNNVRLLPSKKELYTENTIMEALDAKADLLQKMYLQNNEIDKLALAVNCYELAFEVESKLMQGFSYDESLARQAGESRQRSEKAIIACHKLFSLTTQDSWAEKAFLFAEKSKAVVLYESVRQNIAANGKLQNDSLLQKVQLLQREVAWFERRLYENDDPATEAVITQKKYIAENELLSAKTALMHSRNGYREALLKPDSLSISHLKNKLPGRTTAIAEFFEGENNTWAFIISKDRPVRFLQYDAGLAMLTDSLLGYFADGSLIGNDPDGFLQIAHSIYDTLQWEQISKDWKQLIIISDGRLSFLPFDALTTAPSASGNLQQAPYLLHRYELTYTYSAAILLKQAEQPAQAAGALMAFAPAFLKHERQQQPLPDSEEEIKSIPVHRQTKKFVSTAATLSNFKTALDQAGILHIATHAYADTSASGIPRIELIDSSLLLSELYAWKTKASLVVLSGCETGIGKISKSEGPLSLARGFYYAGATNVITSYWNVDDKSTASLFSDFYRNIDKDAYSRALHDAKLNFIKNASPTTASPYYWAGFIHIGSLQNAGNTSRSGWWWLWLIPLFFFAAWLYKIK